MKIIFSHGRSGQPNGKKIQRLSAIATDFGYSTQSVDYTDTKDPDIRAQRLMQIVQSESMPFCLVGSSMGGYASLVAAEAVEKSLLRGVFLMAPALYLPRYRQQKFSADLPHVEIVHGWQDEVVLYEHSVRYAQKNGYMLHLLADNHHLDQQPQTLDRLFQQFLKTIS